MRYRYIYPFGEALAGILTVAGALICIAAPVALFIGTVARSRSSTAGIGAVDPRRIGGADRQLVEVHRAVHARRDLLPGLAPIHGGCINSKNVWLAPPASDFLTAFQSAPTYPVSGP